MLLRFYRFLFYLQIPHAEDRNQTDQVNGNRHTEVGSIITSTSAINSRQTQLPSG